MDKTQGAAKSNSDPQPFNDDQLTRQQAVVEQIRQTLSCLGYAQLSAVKCAANGDEILLTGELDSFYLKQVAQSVAIKIPGVKNVRNEIKVV